MWRKILGAVVITWGLVGVGYLTWCQHRVSFDIMTTDPAWPRRSPYPDRWLARWYARIDMAHPVPPGHFKVEGEWYRLWGQIRAWTISAFVVVAVGVALLLWPGRGSPSRPSSVRRGLALGLVAGAAWSALLSHAAVERSVWLSLVAYAGGFAAAGAIVGAVRCYPELVGLCAIPLAILAFASAALVDIDEIRSMRINHEVEMRDALRSVFGVDWDLAWVAAVGGSGLLWGPAIGMAHRLCRPVPNPSCGVVSRPCRYS